MLRITVSIAAIALSLSAISAHAQEVVLGQLYGNGVHAYFAGDFVRAHDQLSAAVAGGSRDPRVYYFRGLAYLKLGRGPEATQDFQKGAELESKDTNRSFNVARSLERVQGAARRQLETYRVVARLAALEEANKIRKARFEAIQREEERVLRNQAAQAPAETVPASEAQPGEKAAEIDPFGNPPAPKEPAKSGDAKAAEPPAEPPAEPSTPLPAEKPADAGAFGSGAAEPPAKAAQPPVEMTPEKPATETKSAPKKSIFGALIKGGSEGIKKSVGGLGNMIPSGAGIPGAKAPGAMAPPANAVPGPAPAEADPFGPSSPENPAPPMPPAAAPPVAVPPSAEPKPSDDPFAPRTEQEKAPPPEKPAEAKVNPFQAEPVPAEKPAEKKPADEKPAAADPFA